METYKVKKQKIAIVGNCQVRPLKHIIEKLCNSVEVIGTPIVHLLKDQNLTETYQILDKADIIVTQVIADNYPCNYIRTNRLKNTYPGKIITILNLFYSGYTPDWLYVRIADRGTLKGPMGDYHNFTIIESWLSGKSAVETAELLFDKKYNQEKYASSVEASLKELSNREKHVDVPIVDFINDNLKTERLFFTFNHPSLFLLCEYAKRILYRLDKTSLHCGLINNLAEPLNQFIPPLNPGVGFNFPTIKEFRGVDVEIVEGTIKTKGPRVYTTEEIIGTYFEIYTRNADLIKNKYGSSI